MQHSPPAAPTDHAPSARDRLIVALDLPTPDAARIMMDRLGDSVSFYKIGYRLAFAGGLALADEIAARGAHLFLDLKLHDIGNTVREGVASLAALPARFLTVHAYPQTMQGAVQGRADVPGSRLALLAVTALTSYDDSDLHDAGYRLAVRDLVALRARQAAQSGMDGIVCAAAECDLVREAVGAGCAIVTPGVRPAGSHAGDQKRVLTPREAIARGVDYIVIGRPIVQAPDPASVARAIVDDIANAT